MTLKDITVSLELAKKLRKAGYPQKSLFWWEEVQDGFEVKKSWRA
jgi:hypothetical protein